MATCNDGHISKQTPAPARLSNRTFVSTVLPDPGSHKRSLSLGDKEISRSSPSPALEQPFRDRSNTLSEKTALPVIRDKYKDLTGEVEENERYAYEWQRCLGSALDVSMSLLCTRVFSCTVLSPPWFF
ncbi:synergin gamma-like [Alexandromys fortis]|uniref:synergin gamma-like n=1 Tax=Alexandromys fortis TaxID=100897 RepID=UPI002152E367|nr:synergin gamma-like [Microtus fortis]